MTTDSPYDVIIVGTGAGGGTLARRLASSGKRILILERGGFLPQEPKNWDPIAVWGRHCYRSDTWFDPRGRPFDPHVYYYVGGCTKLYGTVLYRLRREDFGELRHHGGISPSWPIGYEDIEPYYCEAEKLYQVHGRLGVDPTDPPASAPLSYPPVSHEPRIQQLHDGLVAKGYNPAPLPVGIMLDEQHPESSLCIRCQTCDGHPCLVHAKCDAEVLGVRPAMEQPNVTLVTGAEVCQIETNSAGTAVTEVVARVKGRKERFAANIVVLAAGAANTARILLLSRSDRYPRGLANGSDQVGRNYMCHNRTVMLAVSFKKNPVHFQKTLAVNDFYFGSDKIDYPFGNIQLLGKLKGPALRGRGSPFLLPSAANWLANRSTDFFLTSEDLPDPENRITVDDEENITVHYRPNNVESMRQLERHWKRVLRSLPGFRSNVCFVHRVRKGGLGHQAGTCRFGIDPINSVLDANCRAHELDNLYVADASFFPSIGAVNPSLTIIANAMRVGDHLLHRLG